MIIVGSIILYFIIGLVLAKPLFKIQCMISPEAKSDYVFFFGLNIVFWWIVLFGCCIYITIEKLSDSVWLKKYMGVEDSND
jgi:hypothetical protein